MPTRRIWRYKPRTEPLTAFQWAFFLVQDIAGFDRLAAREGDDAAQFFMMYYADGWREVYAAHREAIEAEWRERGWTQKRKRFVMTPYFERGLTLKHDAARAERMELWDRWTKSEGWKTETWQQYLDRECGKGRE
jgi:hypothetical protein